MLFFWILMTVLALECLLSLWWLRRVWRHIPKGRWRAVLVAAVAGIGLSLGWFIASRMGWLPKVRPLTALGMIWCILGVPFGIAPCLLCFAGADVARRYRAFRHVRAAAKGRSAGAPQAGAAHPVPVHAPAWTRRQLLTTGLAIAPLAATYAAAGVGVAQAWSFRRRRLDVPVPGLPAALAGLRIVHVSDTHVGGFTPAENLAAIATAVAQEQPELIVFTGDLIDHSNADLPAALGFCEKLSAIAPLCLCEGNHDRIDDVSALRQAVKARGFHWLVEGESRLLSLRNQAVQVIGGGWSFKPASHAAAVAQAAVGRDGGAFPILLMHHPDAFDAAAEAGFPLMFAGHSHGGQLMLTENLGAGPVMFNYWSGLYRKNNASLVVSNGVGHWFPLRVNAPAEIGVLTLVLG